MRPGRDGQTAATSGSRRNGAAHGLCSTRAAAGDRERGPRTTVLFHSVSFAGLMHLGRRTQKDAELAVALEDGRGVDEGDVCESGAG